MSDQQKTCATCKASIAQTPASLLPTEVDKSKVRFLECHRHAPVPVVRAREQGDKVSSVWPTVRPTDSCCEWL